MEAVKVPQGLTREEIDRRIESHVIGYRNCHRDREMLRRRLFYGITYEQLAEEFHLSVRQTKTIIYRGENMIF